MRLVRVDIVQALGEREGRVGKPYVRDEAGDVVEGFVVQLLVVHIGKLVCAVVDISGALAAVLAVAPFADAVADAVAGGVGGGAVGAGEGVGDLGGFVVGNDEGFGGESALESKRVSLHNEGGLEKWRHIHCCSVRVFVCVLGEAVLSSPSFSHLTASQATDL